MGRVLGRKVGRPKICPVRVKFIRELRAKGLSYREIEDELSVSRTTAWRYAKDVKPDE